MRHIISAVVENKSGVLAHISGLFSSRGYNIESLAVGETEDPRYSRMTIVAKGDELIIEQIRKQLDKAINVIKVTDFTGQECIERDLMLIKVNAAPSKRPEISSLVNAYEAKIVDIGINEVIIEVTGCENKINSFINLLQPYGIKEVVRTGRIGILTSPKEK